MVPSIVDAGDDPFATFPIIDVGAWVFKIQPNWRDLALNREQGNAPEIVSFVFVIC